MISKTISLAQKTLSIEAHAILELSNRLANNPSFDNAINMLMKCTGKVIVIGMGKSGHIACKIAATLASTGTPSFFIHPAEASHGDIGMIQETDIVILISNSGETGEVVALLPALKRKNISLVAITGNYKSTIALEADIHLDARVELEACPHNLAPTTSTTVVLALGDAIAICLLDVKGFSEQDFAISHPGGNLGKRLLTRVKDIMRIGEKIPMLDINASLGDALIEMTQKGLGMTCIVDSLENKKLLGIFTDGDLRRLITRLNELSTIKISQVMNNNPKIITPEHLAVEAVSIMEQNLISQILVVNNINNKNVVGAFNMQDLLLAKIV